jgi:hypothetical protein
MVNEHVIMKTEEFVMNDYLEIELQIEKVLPTMKIEKLAVKEHLKMIN